MGSSLDVPLKKKKKTTTISLVIHYFNWFNCMNQFFLKNLHKSFLLCKSVNSYMLILYLENVKYKVNSLSTSKTDDQTSNAAKLQ